jgi:MarR family 2-MHQ and catechol resistance regulon transcriptional repressor
MACRYQGSKEEARALDAYVKLMRASESVTARLSPHVAAAGLSFSQFGALEALLHLGPLCQKELGEKLLKSSGNITLVVDNLEKRGLARRERNTGDRRYVTVHLTETGQALIADAFPRHAAAIAAEMAALEPAELDELARLCRKLGLKER